MEIPEFRLEEEEEDPIGLEDRMAIEDTSPNRAQEVSLFKRHLKSEYMGVKERVPSRTIFKKKNLSKQRQQKVGFGQRVLPVLALHRSESLEKRQMKSSQQRTIMQEKSSGKGMSIFEYLWSQHK